MTYRQIHTELWDDSWVLDLTPEEKLLWVYLFSNSRTHMIGLYDLSWKKASFETGLDPATIETAVRKFEEAGKLKRDGSWVWVRNLLVRNCANIRSPSVQGGIRAAFQDIPDSCPLKGVWVSYYNDVIAPQYDIDTISYDGGTISDGGEDISDTESIFEYWWNRLEYPPAGSNRTAELMGAFMTLYPTKEPPSYGRLGAAVKRVGSASHLLKLLWAAVPFRPGDPITYVEAMAKKGGSHENSSADSQIVLANGSTPTIATEDEFYSDD